MQTILHWTKGSLAPAVYEILNSQVEKNQILAFRKILEGARRSVQEKGVPLHLPFSSWFVCFKLHGQCTDWPPCMPRTSSQFATTSSVDLQQNVSYRLIHAITIHNCQIPLIRNWLTIPSGTYPHTSFFSQRTWMSSSRRMVRIVSLSSCETKGKNYKHFAICSKVKLKIWTLDQYPSASSSAYAFYMVEVIQLEVPDAKSRKAKSLAYLAAEFVRLVRVFICIGSDV